MADRRRATGVLAAALTALLLGLAAPSSAQLLPGGSSTTTTPAPTTTEAPPTTAAPSTTTTAPAPSTTEAPAEPPSTAVPAEDPAGGAPDDAPPADDGAPADVGPVPRTVPPDAQRIIDAVPRSRANSSQALRDAIQPLIDLGLDEAEAYRIGFGRFPVAGVATFTHDWLFPRYGPGFRFHMGTDVFAPFGTPLRAPVDGTVTAGQGGLGGLFVKVFQPDGTYFYMAHLSGLVEGFQDGMEVRTGDIVGYVGDSGNAKGGSPHVHLGIYPQGGAATDPKPVLDQMLADAQAALPAIVDQVRTQQAAQSASAADGTPRTPRALLATTLLRPLVSARAAGGASTALLYETVGNPTSGGLAVAEAEAEALVSGIDWDARAESERSGRAVVARAEQLLRQALGPFTPSR